MYLGNSRKCAQMETITDIKSMTMLFDTHDDGESLGGNEQVSN